MSNVKSSRLNFGEFIKASRTALLSIGVLSVFALLTSIDKVNLASTISKYDRFLVEYWIIKNSEQTPFEVGDGLDNFYDNELGLEGLSVFAKLAHYRVSLIDRFKESYCTPDQKVWTHRRWEITVSNKSCDKPDFQDFEVHAPEYSEKFECDSDGRMDCEAANKLVFQSTHANPAEIWLKLQHQSGLNGVENDEVQFWNEHYYVSTSNGCNLVAGKSFRIGTQVLPKLETPTDGWDCFAMTSSKDADHLTSMMDGIIAAREGVDFARDRTRDLGFYQGYLEGMERLYDGSVSLPLVDLALSSNLFIYAIFALILVLLAWANLLLIQMVDAGDIYSDSPWVNQSLAEFRRSAGLQRWIIGATLVLPLMLIKTLAYFLPSIVILYLCYFAWTAQLPGTRSLDSVDFTFLLLILPLCLLGAATAVLSETKLALRQFSSLE